MPYSGTEKRLETKLGRIADKSAHEARPIFTSLYHLLNEEMLLACHRELSGNKAVGADEVTKEGYSRNLEENIRSLVIRIKNKSYKPQPVKRVYMNIYMHHVLMLWHDLYYRKRGRGESFLVVFADDFITGFEYKSEAERYYRELKERLAKFGLEMEMSKSRLLEFGRYAKERRRRRGEGKSKPAVENPDEEAESEAGGALSVLRSDLQCEDADQVSLLCGEHAV